MLPVEAIRKRKTMILEPETTGDPRADTLNTKLWLSALNIKLWLSALNAKLWLSDACVSHFLVEQQGRYLIRILSWKTPVKFSGLLWLDCHTAIRPVLEHLRYHRKKSSSQLNTKNTHVCGLVFVFTAVSGLFRALIMITSRLRRDFLFH